MLITRTLLSTPGNQVRMLEKAPGYGADALMFDLEDSVPAADKAMARELVRMRLDSTGDAAVVFIRVNAWESGLLEADVTAVVAPHLQGIVVPKVESPDSIREIDALLQKAERAAGIAAGRIELAPALESARGIWFAYELLAASPRCRTVLVGTAEGETCRRTSEATGVPPVPSCCTRVLGSSRRRARWGSRTSWTAPTRT